MARGKPSKRPGREPDGSACLLAGREAGSCVRSIAESTVTVTPFRRRRDRLHHASAGFIRWAFAGPRRIGQLCRAQGGRDNKCVLLVVSIAPASSPPG